MSKPYYKFTYSGDGTLVVSDAATGQRLYMARRFGPAGTSNVGLLNLIARSGDQLSSVVERDADELKAEVIE